MDESILWKWLAQLGIAHEGDEELHPQLGKVRGKGMDTKNCSQTHVIPEFLTQLERNATDMYTHRHVHTQTYDHEHHHAILKYRHFSFV